MSKFNNENLILKSIANDMDAKLVVWKNWFCEIQAYFETTMMRLEMATISDMPRRSEEFLEIMEQAKCATIRFEASLIAYNAFCEYCLKSI